MLQLIKSLFGVGVNFKELVAKGAIIIDVRTGTEYDAGHIQQSKNIPIDRIGTRIEELKRYNKPVICVCATGTRSGMAKSVLRKNGIEAYNGGRWSRLSRKLQ